MPALSFDDLTPSAQSSPTNALSFDDLVPKAQAPETPQPGLWNGVKRGAGEAYIGFNQTANDLAQAARTHLPDWANNAIGTPAQPKLDENREILNDAAQIADEQGKGTGITGTIGEAAGNPLNYVPGMGLLKYGAMSGFLSPQENDTGLTDRAGQAALEAPAVAATGWLADKALATPIQWAANKSGLTGAVSWALQKIGLGATGGDLHNLAQQAGLDVSGKNPQEIADSLRNWYQQQTQDLASKVSTAPYSPEGTFKGIASNWSGEQGAANDAFKAARDAGKSVTQQIPQLPAKLDSIIGAMEGNTLPGTNEHMALQQLKNIRATLPDNAVNYNGLKFAGAAPTVAPAEVPASTLMDLRASLNEGFNPKLLPERGDMAVNNITSDVRGALADAAQKNPAFGQQLQYADARQANLGYNYKNNALLQKFFKPEDLTALEQNAAAGFPVPDITQKRAGALLSAIKTPEDLATLTKAMPSDLSDAMKAAKVQQMMDNAGFDVKKLSDPEFGALMQKSLGNDPEALKQFGTIRQVADMLNRRNINVMSPQAAQQANHDISPWVRSAWDAFEHRKAYAVRMAYRALTGEEKGGLTGLQKEIQEGAPFRKALPEIASQITPRLVTGGVKGAPPTQTIAAPAQPMSYQTTAQEPDTAMMEAFRKAESGGNDNAQNPNSTASGPYQFTNGTWAGMVKKYGKGTGITLQDKANPQAQAVMARLLAQDNIKTLQAGLGRTPTKGELYMAHVLGADGAKRLIQAQGTGRQAIMLYPKAVTAANKGLFFNNGQPVTTEQLYQTLNDKV